MHPELVEGRHKRALAKLSLYTNRRPVSTLAHRLTVIHLAPSGLASNAKTTLSVPGETMNEQSSLPSAAPHPASGVTSAHQLTHLIADLAPKHLLGRARKN